MGRRYKLHLSYIKELEGNSFKDEFMQRTLKMIYNINLSEEELSAFVNYLTERDRHYPSWSKVENLLLVNPESYHQAYLEYKAKKYKPSVLFRKNRSIARSLPDGRAASVYSAAN